MNTCLYEVNLETIFKHPGFIMQPLLEENDVEEKNTHSQ